jgi:hypothetical protein
MHQLHMQQRRFIAHRSGLHLETGPPRQGSKYRRQIGPAALRLFGPISWVPNVTALIASIMENTLPLCFSPPFVVDLRRLITLASRGRKKSDPRCTMSC